MSTERFFVGSILADSLSIGGVFEGTFEECIERGIQLVKEQTELPADDPDYEPFDEDARSAVRDEIETDLSFMDPDGAWCVNIFQVEG